MPEDGLLTAKNKWLIAHEEAEIEGAFNGLCGNWSSSSQQRLFPGKSFCYQKKESDESIHRKIRNRRDL